jgi:hypothetical protein
MIDLHIHSNKSDGTDTPLEILKKAEALKLKYISFTDHESVEAYKELEKIDVSKYFEGKIIKGIELKSFYHDHIIDILGYNIDLISMQKHLDKYFKQNTHAVLQTKYLKNFYKQAEDINLKLTPFEELDWNPDNDWASIVLYNEIRKYPENKSKLPEDLWNNGFTHFNQNYTYNRENIFFNDKSEDYPSPKATVEAIHNAGGKAFVAHTYEYVWMNDKVKFLDEMREKVKVDGFECFHSSFNDDNSKFLINYCKNYNLYMSGGSDYHGDNKPGVKLGVGRENLKISENILQWL